jgi:hypothetical protein
MTPVENNTIEAEVVESSVVEPMRITVDPQKVLRRMLARGWRTQSTKKNLSPNRVEKRRKRNKQAKKSRQR